MKIEIRPEAPGDESAIAALIRAAFTGHPHSSGTEARIVADLRAQGALLLSLVALDAGTPVGHIAFSEARMADGAIWLALGPLAVLPSYQGRGVGSSLVRAAFERLDGKAQGYVLVGDPAYYHRFGFAAAGASYPGVPANFVLTRRIRAPVPKGPVTYHPAFTG